MNHRINESMNDEAVSRTAPATPGLLIISLVLFLHLLLSSLKQVPLIIVMADKNDTSEKARDAGRSPACKIQDIVT